MRTRSLATGAAISSLLAVTVAGCGSGHGRAAPATVPDTVRASTTSSTQPPPSGPFAWSRVNAAALAVGGGPSSTLSAVVPPAGDRPWTIAGTRESATAVTTATVWTSATGSTWSPQPLTTSRADSHAAAAAAWRNSTVVVGWTGSGTETVATVWIAHGPLGQFAPVPVGAGRGSSMTAVAAGALGVFAAGVVSGHVAFWYSGDGVHWSRLASAEGTVNDSSGPHIQTLLETSDSVLAGGWVRDGDHTDAALWSSNDGISWHSVSPPQAEFAGGGDRVITSLAPLGNGLDPGGFIVAGGIRVGNTWTPASWISPDGQSWSAPSRAFPVGPRPQGNAGGVLISGLSATLSASRLVRMVAVGSGESSERIWQSTDGLHWREIALPAAAADSSGWRATLVAINETSAVIADGEPEQPHVLVDGPAGWLQPSSNPAVFGQVRPTARPVALASSGSRAVLAAEVTAGDQSIGPDPHSVALLGYTPSGWSAEPSAAFTGSTLSGVAAGTERFVAVGTRTIAGRLRAVAWANSGGRWIGPVPLDPSAPAYPDGASGVCASGGDFAAVGSVSRAGGSTSPRAWVSADGVHWRVATTAGIGRTGVTLGAMTGCAPADVATSARTGPAFEAYGVSSASVSTPQAPAFWTSTGGVSWSLSPALVGSGLPSAIDQLAGSGHGWIAVAAGPPDPLNDSRQLYESTSGTAPWQLLDTTGPIWQGAFGAAEVDLATWIGSSPLVAGSADDRLLLWSGTARP